MTCHHSDPIFNCESCAPAPAQPARVALRGISLGVRQTLWYGTEPPRTVILWIGMAAVVTGAVALELLVESQTFAKMTAAVVFAMLALVFFPELAFTVGQGVGIAVGTWAEFTSEAFKAASGAGR